MNTPTKGCMIHTSEGVAFVINSTPYDCSTTHPNFDIIMEAVKEGRWDDIPELVNIKKSLTKFVTSTNGVIVIHEDYITYNGERIHGTIVDRMIDMIAQGFDVQPLFKFLTNMLNNPRQEAIAELYDFLSKAKLPITDDGHFLAYKRVNDDYTSVHDGKTDNSIGSTPTIPRETVDPNRHETCSVGLHFCSFDYLQRFSGSRIVILKINPADVVAIPSDYYFAKGRAWTYLVEGEVKSDTRRNVLGECPSVVESSVEVPTSSDFPSAVREVATPAVLGYDAGYRETRYKTTEPNNPFERGVDGHDEWTNGWVEGAYDAKKRNARKHKSPARVKPV